MGQTASTTVCIKKEHHDELIRQSEQLRILKNYIKQTSVFVKGDILELIQSMEGGNSNE